MMKKIFVYIFIILSLSACVGEIPTSEVKQWEDLTFRVETRPAFIERGMMEFLIIANRPGRKPAFNLLVYLRVGPTGEWVQAIEDGHVGVYRRALRVRDPAKDVLYVHIKRDDKEGVIEFPLAYGIKP